MNNLISTVTSTGFRKYLYRVAWAGLAVAIAYGRLDATQLQVIMGLVAAVLAVADSQTNPDATVGDVDDAWAQGVVAGMGIAEIDTTGTPALPVPDWEPPAVDSSKGTEA